jgi:predicted nucleic acid-binding protein
MKYIVLYDACVLYPFGLRDILIELAMPHYGLFQAKWTERIESEWLENLINDRNDIDPVKQQRVAQRMRNAVPDCIVNNYEKLEAGLVLPDPNDCHVLAAAIKCKAQAIVTYNLKDFPADVLREFDIEAIHPDVFLINQFDLSDARVLDAIKTIRARLNNPPRTAIEYLGRLAVNGLTAFSQRLSEFEHLI